MGVANAIYETSETPRVGRPPVDPQFTHQPFRVESGIPMPGRPRAVFAMENFPFDKMKIGDSFFVDCKGRKAGSVQSCLHDPMRKARLYGKFVTRRVTEDGVPGVRVWRVQ